MNGFLSFLIMTRFLISLLYVSDLMIEVSQTHRVYISILISFICWLIDSTKEFYSLIEHGTNLLENITQNCTK